MKLDAWHERQLARDPEYAKAIAEIDYAQRVADAIVGERVRLGLTQDELAGRAGTTQARISEIERGVGNTTMDILERVFAALRAAAPAADAANLLAAITSVKASAFGFAPTSSGTIVIGSGTELSAAGVSGVAVGAGFLPLTIGVKPAIAAANSNLALAA